MKQDKKLTVKVDLSLFQILFITCLKCVITPVNTLITHVYMSYDPYNTLVSTSHSYDSYNTLVSTSHSYDPSNTLVSTSHSYDPYNTLVSTSHSYDPYNTLVSTSHSYDPYNTLVSTSHRTQSVSINTNWLMHSSILVYNSNQMQKSQSLFYTRVYFLHILGVTITHLQEHKTAVTTASGNRYTVIDRVKFTDKECRQTRLKLQLLNNVYSAKNAISSQNNE